MTPQPFSPQSFTTFGDLLKYLRRREQLTQLELSIAVGYSEAQIGRLEKNQRRPDLTALKALFIPVLHLEGDPELTARFLELAEVARQEDAPAPGFAPYKGLLFFDEADASLFFGRENLIAHLSDRVLNLAAGAATRLLAVVGASGSGKSSLVRAGLAVALKREGWEVRVFTPGSNPLGALEMELDSQNSPAEAASLLLLVDQFEETFTLCRDESERALFVEKILALAQETSRKLAVVIAMRADFYSHCAQYPSLRNAIAAQQEYIGQMNAQELRLAIEEPARRGGWELEPGLVDILLNDIGAHGTSEPEPGALPLLSHALFATWERRRGRVLTLDGYHAIGGVRGAIAETAESVFTDQLDQQQQELAREVFLRLTELGEGTEDTRRRAALTEMARQSTEAAQLRTLLNILAEARLITLNEDSAEVAHEALIREWQRLHEWLTHDRGDLLLHRHLTETTHEWVTRGCESSDLYRGARLAQVKEWAESNAARLNELERAFLEASVEQEERESLEREAQLQRELEAAQRLVETERRASGRLRQRAIYLAGALVVALALGVAAWVFSRQARAEQQVSFARELSASAISNLPVDPERSILLALEAVGTSVDSGKPALVEAEDALHRSLQASRVMATLQGHTSQIQGLAISPDGARLASLGDDGTIRIWETSTDEELLSIPTGLTSTEIQRYIRFSPDSKRLAGPAGDRLIKVWDVPSGKVLLTLAGHTDEITAVAFSPDGKQIVSAGWDATALLWDAETGELERTFAGQEAGISTVAFSPDGAGLYTASDGGGQIIAWDVATGEQLFSIERPTFVSVFGIAVSPDGTQFATAEGTIVRIWDAATGQALRTLFGHTSLGSAVDYSPDGKYVVSASEDGTARIWEAESGKQVLTLAGHAGGVLGTGFMPDGDRVATASRDMTIKIWDVSPQGGSDWMNLPGNWDRLFDVAYSPDGSRLAAWGFDGLTRVWEVTSGKELMSIPHGINQMGGYLSFSPDGTRLAMSGGESPTVFDLEGGVELPTLEALPGCEAATPTFSPDGTRIAAGCADGTIRVYDGSDGIQLHQIIAGPDGVEQIFFSPDGKRLAAQIADLTTVWDATTGESLLTFQGHGAGIRANGTAFSPDSKWIATSGNDGTVMVWDSTTGEEWLTLPVSGAMGVAFSPDGKMLATSSVDGTIKLWVLPKEGEQISEPLTLYGNSGAVIRIAFSPDGKQLASAGRDHVIHIYDLDIGELIEIAQSRLTRGLTEEECQKYLHTGACPAD